MKVFEMWSVRSWFLFEQKAVVLCQVMQILKKLFLVMHHEYPYDTRHQVVINHAKFDACTYSSFKRVKTDTQNCTLNIRFKNSITAKKLNPKACFHTRQKLTLKEGSQICMVYITLTNKENNKCKQ